MLTHVLIHQWDENSQSFDVGQRGERERKKKISFSFQTLPVSIPIRNGRTCFNWKATRFVQLFVTRNIPVVTGTKIHTVSRDVPQREFESSFPSLLGREREKKRERGGTLSLPIVYNVFTKPEPRIEFDIWREKNVKFRRSIGDNVD